jgi:hypothetical protein
VSEIVTVRAARKEHVCTFCNAPVRMGESYIRIRLTPWDHELNESFFTWKAHPYCYEAWHEIGEAWNWEWDDYAWMEFRDMATSDSAPWVT